MSLSAWSRWLRRPSRTPRKSRRPVSFRPRLEPLEDRVTPAVITVTSSLDTVAVDGMVTLREALLSTNANAAGNVVGVDPTGFMARPNFEDGIHVEGGSGNTIGGLTPADRNVASGNGLDGIHVVGTLTLPATGNTIQGNFVGFAADGRSSVGT